MIAPKTKYGKDATNTFAQSFSMQTKKPSDSFIMMTELVLPNDTNVFGNLMGGRLMYWMDIAAAIAAQRHCNAPVVTASVDNISFENPIKIGNTVHIEARVSRAFNTSMEVHIKVWGEDFTQQYKYKSNEAYYTFVALDPHRKPKRVPQLRPETEEEKSLFEGALRRRQLRLHLLTSDRRRRNLRIVCLHYRRCRHNGLLYLLFLLFDTYFEVFFFDA